MKPLAVADLWKLEEYAEQRSRFRNRVLAHKKNRMVHLGPHMTLLFEDRLLVQYQVQEMLRIERIFERTAIEEELAAYNPLIPDGGNWKATCLIEFEDAEERRRALRRLLGVEAQVWVCVGGGERIRAIADEDLDRSDAEKTSAVHFLRFELPPAAVAAAKGGAPLSMGVDHPEYRHQCELAPATRLSLAADLD